MSRIEVFDDRLKISFNDQSSLIIDPRLFNIWEFDKVIAEINKGKDKKLHLTKNEEEAIKQMFTLGKED
jgi:hypothetical protein